MAEYIVTDAKLYSNYILSSSLITSPSINAASNSSSIIQMNYDLNNYTMEDYSEISDNAIQAYQNEVNKGTINNPDVVKSSVLYNNLINSSPKDLTSYSYGLTGNQIYNSIGGAQIF